MTRRYIKRPPRSLLRARKERRIHNNYKTTHYCIIIILKRETLRESGGNKNQATSQIDEETYCTFVGLPFVFFCFFCLREAAETKIKSRCNKLQSVRRWPGAPTSGYDPSLRPIETRRYIPTTAWTGIRPERERD